MQVADKGRSDSAISAETRPMAIRIVTHKRLS